MLGAMVGVGRLRPGAAAKLGEVPGSARAVGNANLRSLGLENVELKGASFNAGAKQLQKAGFQRLPDTATGRRVFVHPENGTRVLYDSSRALSPGQKPHWHVQDVTGKDLGASGRVTRSSAGAAHIPGR